MIAEENYHLEASQKQSKKTFRKTKTEREKEGGRESEFRTILAEN